MDWLLFAVVCNEEDSDDTPEDVIEEGSDDTLEDGFEGLWALSPTAPLTECHLHHETNRILSSLSGGVVTSS